MIAYRDFTRRTMKYTMKASTFGIFIMMLCTSTLHSGFLSPHTHPEELLELNPKKKTSSLYIQDEVAGMLSIRGWHQDHIAVSIQKHTHSDDDADRISTTLNQTENGVITLAITTTEALHKRASIDVTVHLPHTLATTIMAHNDVTITDTNGTIHVETEEGTITTHNTRGTLKLETEKGNITCEKSHGPLHAMTKHGALNIQESYNSITAETARGPIIASCARVPSTARIELRTQKRGTITLTLPESTNAHLIADTTRGTVTSNLLITLEQHTMVLNHGTYQDLQRHVRGVIGQQATAEIRLNGTKDIHITTNDSDFELD